MARAERRFATLLLACLAGSAAAADPALQWRWLGAGDDVYPRGVATLDFDADGGIDIAIAASGGAPSLRVVGLDAQGRWRIEQALPLDSDVVGVSLAAWDEHGEPRLAQCSSQGTGTLFGGRPLRRLRNFVLFTGMGQCLAADVDADGDVELIASGFFKTSVLDTATWQELWSARPADHAAVAQLDADAALEIVLGATWGSNAGTVIDGATQALDWSYQDGCGSFLASGRCGPAGEPWFAGSSAGGAIVFRTQPFSPVWQAQGAGAPFAAGDLDGDGRDELIAVGPQSSLQVVDTATWEPRLSLPSQAPYPGALAAADTDGDGAAEIVLAGTSASLLQVRRADGTLLYDMPPGPSPALPSARPDLDRDGRDEVMLATSEAPGRLSVLDARSGEAEWEVSGVPWSANDPMYLGARKILVGQADDDASLEIVIVGNATYTGRIAIVDVATRAVQQHLGGHDSGPFAQRRLAGAAWVDFDGDGRQELLLGSGPEGSSTGSRLHVVSLPDFRILWESVALGGHEASILDVAVTQADGDPAPELVAVLHDGLRAFDAATQLLEWSLPLPVEHARIDAARREIFIASGNVVAVHGLDDRAFLRQFELPARIDGLSAIEPASGALAAVAGGELLVADAGSGDVLARAGDVGPPPWAQAAGLEGTSGRHAWSLRTGSPFALSQFDWPLPHVVFHDEFED